MDSYVSKNNPIRNNNLNSATIQQMQPFFQVLNSTLINYTRSSHSLLIQESSDRIVKYQLF